MRRIRKKDYDSWQHYYWNYQQILAEDYYIPYLKNKGKVSQLNTKYSPKLSFQTDYSFSEAKKINELINSK